MLVCYYLALRIFNCSDRAVWLFPFSHWKKQIVSSQQATEKEHTSMVWPCHEEKGRVNAQGYDAVKDEGKETKRKDYVARQHRSSLERIAR